MGDLFHITKKNNSSVIKEPNISDNTEKIKTSLALFLKDVIQKRKYLSHGLLNSVTSEFALEIKAHWWAGGSQKQS